MGRRFSASVSGTPSTQVTASSSVISHAFARFIPRTSGLRAAADRRVPSQSGHGPSVRKRATRARPFSSFAFASAFSTV